MSENLWNAAQNLHIRNSCDLEPLIKTHINRNAASFVSILGQYDIQNTLQRTSPVAGRD